MQAPFGSTHAEHYHTYTRCAKTTRGCRLSRLSIFPHSLSLNCDKNLDDSSAVGQPRTAALHSKDALRPPSRQFHIPITTAVHAARATRRAAERRTSSQPWQQTTTARQSLPAKPGLLLSSASLRLLLRLHCWPLLIQPPSHLPRRPAHARARRRHASSRPWLHQSGAPRREQLAALAQSRLKPPKPTARLQRGACRPRRRARPLAGA